ncbi:MAG: alpha/beta hydrolase [Defluviitaleaceae bacterium]|nr:alpha/beta hydrolase [Defluviitaleaceae bacterium]
MQELLILAGIAAVAILLITFVLSFFMFNKFLKRKKTSRRYMAKKEPWKTIHEELRAEKDWFFSLIPEVLQIKSDGYMLNGYYLSQKSRKTVVLLHGWRDDAISRISSVKFYYNMGFNVFIPDIRAHGKSDGKYIGMGCYDQDDILKWLHVLEQKDECNFVLDGYSMGGATALSLSGRAFLPDSIKVIITEGVYTSVKELLPTKVKPNWPIIKHLLLIFIEFWCKVIVGYRFNEKTPEQMVQRSKIPTLIIHGMKDNFVPLHMAKKLVLVCSAEKDYFFSMDSTHGTVSYYEKEVYEEKIKDFLDKHLK